MKIEQFFQRAQPKADKQAGANKPAAADRGKTDQQQPAQDANDTLPDCDRDVDKVSCLAPAAAAACAAQHAA